MLKTPKHRCGVSNGIQTTSELSETVTQSERQRERQRERERVEFHPSVGIFARRRNLDARVSEYQVLESVETTRETAV